MSNQFDDLSREELEWLTSELWRLRHRGYFAPQLPESLLGLPWEEYAMTAGEAASSYYLPEIQYYMRLVLDAFATAVLGTLKESEDQARNGIGFHCSLHEGKAESRLAFLCQAIGWKEFDAVFDPEPTNVFGSFRLILNSRDYPDCTLRHLQGPALMYELGYAGWVGPDFASLINDKFDWPKALLFIEQSSLLRERAREILAGLEKFRDTRTPLLLFQRS